MTTECTKAFRDDVLRRASESLPLHRPLTAESDRSHDVALSPDSVLARLVGADVLDTPAVFGPGRRPAAAGEYPPAAEEPTVLRLRDGCDEYFSAFLTPDDLARLATELAALAGRMRATNWMYGMVTFNEWLDARLNPTTRSESE